MELSFLKMEPRWNGLVVSMSASHAVGRGFASLPTHTKDHQKNDTDSLPAWHSGVRVGQLQRSPIV